MEQHARVAVVDDHELVAFALAGIVDAESELVFAGHFTSVQAVVSRPRDVDVVVLDLALRDGTTPADNVDALRRWGAQVVVLTSAEDAYLVREASRTEALGIIRKSAPRAVILAALKAARRGEHIATTEWASALDTDPLLQAAPLTSREREVLGLYAAGMGARDVAAALYVSENTVNDHLRRIRAVYHQVGRPASSKVELYQRSIEDGYLPTPRRG